MIDNAIRLLGLEDCYAAYPCECFKVRKNGALALVACDGPESPLPPNPAGDPAGAPEPNPEPLTVAALER